MISRLNGHSSENGKYQTMRPESAFEFRTNADSESEFLSLSYQSLYEGQPNPSIAALSRECYFL